MGGGGVSQKSDWRDLAIGGTIQTAEAMSLGMPFEVWKTQQISSIRTGKIDSAAESFHKLWGGGVSRFWKGSSAKMTESFLKGGVLFWSTMATMDVLQEMGMNRSSSLATLIAGFMGGVAQTIVISPLTYVVTYRNSNPGDASSSMAILRNTGLKGMFASAPAIALRQGSNWALRFMFAKEVANQYRKAKGAPLNLLEDIACGIIGGILGCINQPAEVLRVVVQSRQAKGEAGVTTRNSAAMVYRTFGFAGFYTGLIPRMGLSAWQTLFMFTFAGRLREAIRGGYKKVETPPPASSLSAAAPALIPAAPMATAASR